MILVFSAESNQSDQVKREVQNAVQAGIPIIPLRIEDVKPSSTMRYFLGTQHWLDALTQPLEQHLDVLAQKVLALLSRTQPPPGAPVGSISSSGSAEIPSAPASVPKMERCVVFLVDQSYSMEERFVGLSQRKCDIVARTIDAWLVDELGRPGQSSDDSAATTVGVIGYGTDLEANPIVQSALPDALGGRKLVDLEELAGCPLVRGHATSMSPRLCLANFSPESQHPAWVAPAAHGGTPTCHVLYETHDLMARWVQEHPQGLPPVVVNITDGESQDGSPVEYALAIHGLATARGKTRMYNCFLSSDAGQSVLFPNRHALPQHDVANTLFEMSTELPIDLMHQARTAGFRASPGARGLAWDCDYGAFLQFLALITRQAW